MTRTNAFSMLCVLVRAGAALLLANVAVNITMMFAANIGHGSETWNDWWIVWSFGLAIVTSVFLWLFPDWLAKIALARKTGEAFESDLDAEAWQAIVNAGLGLYFLGSGVRGLASDLLVAFIHVRGGSAPWPDQYAVNLAGTLAMLAFGLVLLLGARGIAKAVGRLRGRGAGPL